MAAENFKIRLQSEADVAAWVRADKSLEALQESARSLEAQLKQADPNTARFTELSSKLLDVRKSADAAEKELKQLRVPEINTSGLDRLKNGLAFGVGDRVVGGLTRIPDLFVGAIRRGFEFNKTLRDSEVGIANVLKKFQGLSDAEAKAAGADAIKQLQAIEPKAAGTLEQLTNGFLATAASAQGAGVNVEQNIDLVGKFSNALANASIPAEQLTQELRSIFTGNITPDSQLAQTLGITSADVRKAKEAGDLYNYLDEKIGALGESGDTAGVAFSTLSSAIDKSLGALAEGVFENLVQGAKDLNEALSQPGGTDGFKEVGRDIGELVKWLKDSVTWLVEHRDALLDAGKGAAVFLGALTILRGARGLAGLAAGFRGLGAAGTEAMNGLAMDKAFGIQSQRLFRDQALLRTKFIGTMRGIFQNAGLTIMTAIAGWELGSFLRERLEGWVSEATDGKLGNVGELLHETFSGSEAENQIINSYAEMGHRAGAAFGRALNAEDFEKALRFARQTADLMKQDGVVSGQGDKGQILANLEKQIVRYQDAEEVTRRISVNRERAGQKEAEIAAELQKQTDAIKAANDAELDKRDKTVAEIELAVSDKASDQAKGLVEKLRREVKEAAGRDIGGLSGTDLLKLAKPKLTEDERSAIAEKQRLLNEEAARLKSQQDAEGEKDNPELTTAIAQNNKQREELAVRFTGGFSEEALDKIKELIPAERALADALRQEADALRDKAEAAGEAALADELLAARAKGGKEEIAAAEERLQRLKDYHAAERAARESGAGGTDAVREGNRAAELQAMARERERAEEEKEKARDKADKAADLDYREKTGRAKAAAIAAGDTTPEDSPAVRALEVEKGARDLAKEMQEIKGGTYDEALAKARELVSLEKANEDATKNRGAAFLDKLSARVAAYEESGRGSRRARSPRGFEGLDAFFRPGGERNTGRLADASSFARLDAFKNFQERGAALSAAAGNLRLAGRAPESQPLKARDDSADKVRASAERGADAAAKTSAATAAALDRTSAALTSLTAKAELINRKVDEALRKIETLRT